jgi:hypothetical protein
MEGRDLVSHVTRRTWLDWVLVAGAIFIFGRAWRNGTSASYGNSNGMVTRSESRDAAGPRGGRFSSMARD